jgi:hypothetical protein
MTENTMLFAVDHQDVNTTVFLGDGPLSIEHPVDALGEQDEGSTVFAVPVEIVDRYLSFTNCKGERQVRFYSEYGDGEIIRKYGTPVAHYLYWTD